MSEKAIFISKDKTKIVVESKYALHILVSFLIENKLIDEEEWKSYFKKAVRACTFMGRR